MTDEVAAELSWNSALTWRMRRQSLLDRTPRSSWLDVVGSIGGVHAQLMSSAVAAVAARVHGGVTADEVAAALWSERSLVKLWAMRGTLHLLPATDHPTWIAALTATYKTAYRHYRICDPELLELAEVLGELLSDRVLTRRELADEVRRTGRVPASVIDLLAGSWGSVLKPASFLGLLCHGPATNRESGFTNPRTWLSAAPQVFSEQDAVQEIARRYFAGYAPAAIRDFAAWWGVPQRAAAAIVDSIRTELATIQIGEGRYYVPQRYLDEMLQTEPASADHPVVRLLPSFDPWVVGGNRTSKPGIGNPTLDPDRRTEVYRRQGWVSAVITVNGVIIGTWTRHRNGKDIDLQTCRALGITDARLGDDPPGDKAWQGIVLPCGFDAGDSSVEGFPLLSRLAQIAAPGATLISTRADHGVVGSAHRIRYKGVATPWRRQLQVTDSPTVLDRSGWVLNRRIAEHTGYGLLAHLK